MVVTLKSKPPSQKGSESKLPSVTGISVPKTSLRRRCDPVEETSMVNQPPPTPIGGLSRATSERILEGSMSVKNSFTRDDLTNTSRGKYIGIDKATTRPDITIATPELIPETLDITAETAQTPDIPATTTAAPEPDQHPVGQTPGPGHSGDVEQLDHENEPAHENDLNNTVEMDDVELNKEVENLEIQDNVPDSNVPGAMEVTDSVNETSDPSFFVTDTDNIDIIPVEQPTQQANSTHVTNLDSDADKIKGVSHGLNPKSEVLYVNTKRNAANNANP